MQSNESTSRRRRQAPPSPYLQEVSSDDESASTSDSLPETIPPEPPQQHRRPPLPPTPTASRAPAPPSPIPAPIEIEAQDAATPATPRQTQQRLRNVDDLATRNCWICYGDEDSLEWVHACKCTLIAHKSCLLKYIESRRVSSSAPPRCPACGTLYRIQEFHSNWLVLYRKMTRTWDRASLILACGGLVAGTWVSMGAYGAVVVRIFAGPEVAELLFYGKERWPLSYYINLPLIPISLVLSRTTLLDSLFPFLPLTLVLSSTTSPSSPTLRLIDLSTLSYPFSPALTLCLLPWIRLLYSKARARVFNSVLGFNAQPREGLIGLMRELGEGGEGDAGGQENLVIVAELDIEGHEGGANAGQAPQQGDEMAEQEREEEGGEAGQRLRVGLSRFTSLVVGALMFPVFSAVAGSCLFWLATRSSNGNGSSILRKILGLQAVLAAAKSSAGLKSGGGVGSWLKAAGAVGIGAGVAQKKNLDPVWIRNALGGGLVVLGRDLIKLYTALMEKRRHESRQVIGRGFDASLELDFKTPPTPTETGLNGLGLGVNGDGNQNPTGAAAPRVPRGGRRDTATGGEEPEGQGSRRS